MAHLPLEKKPLIQASYVRFRELAKEMPEADKKVTIGRFAHWGGLVVVVLVFIRGIIGIKELPEFLGAAGFLLLIIGWPYKHGQIKKQETLWDEEKEIRTQMNEINVYFSNSFDRVTVYSGPITSENIVDPLNDGSYR